MTSANTLTPEDGFPVPVDLGPTTRAALWLFATVMAVLALWGVFAELHAGAVAMGEVTPYGRSKTVQHLEGGIIREIKVRDGDTVALGQELIRLDDGEARAAVAIAETERSARAALAARLIAERDSRAYQPEKAARNGAIDGQLRLFESRRNALHREIASLTSRVEQLGLEHVAWQKKSGALAALGANADEEKRINQGLYEKNFISLPKLLELDSRSLSNHASIGESEAEMARVQQRIGDTEMQIAKLRNDWMNAVLEDLRRAQDELAVATEKHRVADERLSRTNITAPQDGIIKGLHYVTLGAVVPPGGTLLDVVPVSERMVIEAKIQPDDIDVVHIGAPCRVRLTAYKARAHLRFDGKVIEISPATFRDEKTGATYYTARIEVPEEQLRGRAKIEVQPGMLAEVEIKGGARSPLQYLLEPISQNLGRAFKEE